MQQAALLMAISQYDELLRLVKSAYPLYYFPENVFNWLRIFVKDVEVEVGLVYR